MPIRRVRRIRRHRRTVRTFLPVLYPALGLILVALFTNTMLGSDACSVSIVQTLTDAARNAQQHIVPAHRHTRETLIKWEEWGNAYLEKHGHPYQPPVRNVSSVIPASFEESNAPFKFECEVPPLQPVDLDILPTLPYVDETTIETEVPLPIESPFSLPQLPQTSTPSFGFPFVPIPLGYVPFSGAVGPVLTPEPESFLLLGTGLAVLLAFRKRVQRRSVSPAIDLP